MQGRVPILLILESTKKCLNLELILRTYPQLKTSLFQKSRKDSFHLKLHLLIRHDSFMLDYGTAVDSALEDATWDCMCCLLNEMRSSLETESHLLL